MVNPVFLGGGKALLRGIHDRLKLKLLDTKTFGTGVVMLDLSPGAFKGMRDEGGGMRDEGRRKFEIRNSSQRIHPLAPPDDVEDLDATAWRRTVNGGDQEKPVVGPRAFCVS